MPGNELQVGDSMLIAWASLGFSAGALAMLVLVAVLLSSYVKIATVLSIVRAGFGFYSLPSAFITGGLAIALSFFVMYPTLEQATEAAKRAAHSQSGNPTDLSRAQASEAALEQWKSFLIRETKLPVRERFAQILLDASAEPAGQENRAKLSEGWRVIVPAFVVSQLEDAFRTGFMLFLPLLIVELLVGVVLLSLGATQIDTGLVALPLKILLFIALGGWAMITTNLVATYVK